MQGALADGHGFCELELMALKHHIRFVGGDRTGPPPGRYLDVIVAAFVGDTGTMT